MDTQSNRKAELLGRPVEHVDITSFDARPIVEAMGKMSFSSRDTARATDIFNMAVEDNDCSIILTLAGSTSAGGCMHVYRDLVKYGLVDCIVATGASIVDMDFFEALGFKHYQAPEQVDDALEECGGGDGVARVAHVIGVGRPIGAGAAEEGEDLLTHDLVHHGWLGVL